MVEMEKWNRMLADITEKCDALITTTAYNEMEDTMSIDFEEHFAFQKNKSEAFAGGLISEDVAQTIYVALGEVHSQNNGGWATGTTLPMKVLITQLMGELLRLKLKKRGVNV